MMNMTHMMMNGDMGLMMSGMILGSTLWILGLSALAWALFTWLKRQWSGPQPVPHALSSYHSYEQGYHPSPPMPGSEWGGDGSRQPKQEFDQPYASYPQMQEMPPQI
jgi:hypothetical protein